MTLIRKLVSEGIGTAFLLAMVVGSGIMGDKLSGGNRAIALLANSTATGAGLFVLILILRSISGAHFNPAVTLLSLLRKEISAVSALTYVGAQIIGAFAGVAIAHLMFDLPLYSMSVRDRSGIGQFISEFVATFGLVATIFLSSKLKTELIALAVAAYIASAYWFTASTSFANPAVTLARAFTNSFSGINPGNVLLFICVQLFATIVVVWTSNLFSAKKLRRQKNQNFKS